jgi:hypothetical protein
VAAANCRASRNANAKPKPCTSPNQTPPSIVAAGSPIASSMATSQSKTR